MIKQGHVEIFERINDFSVVTLSVLRKELGLPERSYCALKKKVLRLEKSGYIKSHQACSGHEKFLYLADRAFDHFYPEFRKEINPKEVYHDGLVSKICHSFKNLGLSGELITEAQAIAQGYALIPDAINIFEFNGQTHKVAIELELTRKSFERIHKKYLEYLGKSQYSRVFYFFTNENLWRLYSKEFQKCCKNRSESSFKNENQGKVLFFLLSDIDRVEFSLTGSRVLKNESEYRFAELFYVEEGA